MNDSSLGQLILCGVPGKELDAASAEMFRKVQPGGFILFGRNIESAPQLRKLIDDLRDLSEVEPVVTIDQEGGRVSRLRLIGSEPPNAQQLRDKDDVDLIRRHGDITGRLLRVFGFNLDLCPVLDISFDDNADNSLRGRCYGKTVEQVVRNAGVFNDAMRKQGIASCGKHFPGYTCAKSDAHFELPKIDRTREQLDQNELAVFRKFIDQVDSVMICHRIPEIENVQRILGALPREQIDRSLASVARFKKKIAPPHEFSEAAFRKIDNEIWELRVATLGEERAKQRSAEDGKRSPVEIY